MLINTKEFREACKTILIAVDNNAAQLEVSAHDNFLYLSVTNREYFVSVKYSTESNDIFRAVVDANLFLTLVSGLSLDTFELTVDDNVVKIKSGKSSYKLPMIYENEKLMELPAISISNKTVEMTMKQDILSSILNVNSKELVKAKKLDVSELQKLYYITNEGCFTFVSGACLNSFTLEKPIKILLNERIVKLFKLFNSDVQFSFGVDQLPTGQAQSKVAFETSSVYLAAIITNDEILLNTVSRPCEATKNFINENYKNKLVLSVKQLSSAISRIMLFTKNSIDKVNMMQIDSNISITGTDFTIEDSRGNTETVQIENGSFVGENYVMKLNLADLKLVLDSCDDDYITLNCGNGRSVVITRRNISNLIPESIK